MIRQAHTYLVGALSGVVVIGIAIAAFIVLVAGQVFHDLPIPALTSSDQKTAAVSQGKALTGPADHQAVATTGGTGAQPNHIAANRNAAGGQGGGNGPQPPSHQQATPATPTHHGTAPAEAVETPSANGLGGGDQGSSSSGGNSGGSKGNSQPSSGSQSPSSSSNSGSSSGGGGNATGTSGTSGGSNGSSSTGGSTGNSGSSGGSPATGTSGGSTSTSPPPAPVTTAKPSEQITEAVNGAVGSVDEALGGSLSESGVSKVTEEVVNGAAGPESVVGKTVDGVSEVVGGLVNGHSE